MKGKRMLAALILAAHLTAATPSHGVAAVSPVTISAHERHLRHERHLAHLRWLRSQRHTSLSGTLSCSGLETLWSQAGGAYGSRFIAAEIAMAESGGRQYATGAAGERGYWQIHPDHGSLSTYDPLGNARAAILISQDGRSWAPWTTFTSGAYTGRC